MTRPSNHDDGTGTGTGTSAEPEITLRRRRISKACDFCHRRGRKCKAQLEPEATKKQPNQTLPCLTCLEHGVPCTWERATAKRGVKAKSTKAESASGASGALGVVLEEEQGGSLALPLIYDENRHGSKELIRGLISIYFDTVFAV